MKQKIKIALADDQRVVREGIANLLKENEKLLITQIAESGEELLQLIEQSNELPNVAILDIKMPGLNGFETSKELLKHLPDCKIIYLSSYTEAYYIQKAILSKAHGFISKDCAIDMLYEAIEQVCSKGFYYNEYFTAENVTIVRAKPELGYQIKLTEREIAYIQLLYVEKTDQEIAQLMHVSFHTVRAYRKNIMLKLGVNKSIGIIKYAIEQLLV